MILLTFHTPQGLKLGIKTAQGVVNTGLHPDDFYKHGASLPDIPTDAPRLDEVGLQIGACVPNPGKILCIGLNYRRHAAETGSPEPQTPILFSKFNNAIAAPREPIPLPPDVTDVDYEAELVVVIGKRARHVTPEAALDYVLGYCNGNDLSERKLQMLTGQWLLGKSLDKFLPIGPYMVTADEVGDPQNLPIKCWLNGDLRQNSNTADMIFSVAEVISYSSRYMTLEPGDIIATGTPEGVILGMKDKVWMQPGDEVIIEIGALGRLVNTMTAEG